MVDTNDIIEKEDVKNIAQRQAKETLRFREAFRAHNGESAGSSMDFADIEEADDIDAEEFAEVHEGDPFPEANFNYSEQTLYYSKYGLTVSISDEALSDGRLAVVMDGEMQAMRAESRKMDGFAYEVLSGAAASSGAGNADDSLSHDELIQGRAWHRSDAGGNYDPDLCYVEPQGAASLLIEREDWGTESGAESVTSGKIGETAGMEVIESNTGRLAPHDAILVDSDLFGFESIKYEKQVEEERKPKRQVTNYIISDRLGWIATDGAAAAHVDG